MAVRFEGFTSDDPDQAEGRRHLVMLTITRRAGAADVCMPFFAATAPVALGAARSWWNRETTKTDKRQGPRPTAKGREQADG
jgi:hypothetical protein